MRSDYIRRRYRGMLQLDTNCLLCKQVAVNGGLCAACWRELLRQRRQGTRCPCCALLLTPEGGCIDCVGNPPAYGKVYVALDYIQPATLLVHHYKERKQLGVAGILGAAMVAQIQREVKVLEGWCVVPIPSSLAAYRQRGFNPAAGLAAYVAKALNLVYYPHHLRWRSSGLFTRNSATKRLDRTARLEASPPPWHCCRFSPGTRVLLVDDVLTTGSTLHHAANYCLQAGAVVVHAVVAARTPWQ